jgi:hypothetical protein
MNDTCPDCGSDQITSQSGTHPFEYGYKDTVVLYATFPVFICGACLFQYTNYLREEAVDAAVDYYLNGLGCLPDLNLEI